MKNVRKIAAIGMCGLVLGSAVSVLTASPATGRMVARCDTRISEMEASAARLYAKGKITQAQYEQTMAQIAAHRASWGC